MTTSAKSILLFDGVCNLCNALVRFIYKRDKQEKFVYVSLQSKSGQELLELHNLKSDQFDTFAYLKDQTAYLRSSAGLKVLKDIGGIWSFAYIFILIPKPIRDWLYDIIARYRYSIFGKRESCMIPDEDLKSRFLE